MASQSQVNTSWPHPGLYSFFFLFFLTARMTKICKMDLMFHPIWFKMSDWTHKSTRKAFRGQHWDSVWLKVFLQPQLSWIQGYDLATLVTKKKPSSFIPIICMVLSVTAVGVFEWQNPVATTDWRQQLCILCKRLKRNKGVGYFSWERMFLTFTWLIRWKKCVWEICYMRTLNEAYAWSERAPTFLTVTARVCMTEIFSQNTMT